MDNLQNWNRIYKCLEKILSNKQLKVTLNESKKGAIITGAMALTGGIILGPIGLAVGSGVGGFFSYYLCEGKSLSSSRPFSTPL